VLALFMSDMNPAKASTPTLELQNKLGSKAGSWLAKGQQAVKNMDKRKIEGVMTPPVVSLKSPFDSGSGPISPSKSPFSDQPKPITGTGAEI
jgi:hypothetical protein